MLSQKVCLLAAWRRAIQAIVDKDDVQMREMRESAAAYFVKSACFAELKRRYEDSLRAVLENGK